ncbi:MAG TPA: TadE/TadG family type IV pilus assembly protein [Stellaceae bacterium]|nr:TadE/TadG family type IV pilus assembly protein [Stellaceae bacterium]
MKSVFRVLRNPLAAAAATLRGLIERREGNVAILFGLGAIPVIIGAGIATDTARAYLIKTRLGASLDAAALAIGSQSNQTSSTLNTTLNNYFFNNYCRTVPAGTSVSQCSGTVSAETSISVQALGDITAATVNYQATATVPTTFMRLVGINNLTVSVTAQTTKFPGMEIAVVLDNTGSMLCGASDSNCTSGVQSADTDCTNVNNSSRICTLRKAALQFVTTLQQAITGPQSIYMSIVPYVTTVNVGSSLCTNSTTCNHITGSNGNFTDLRGNIMPVVPIIGNTTNGNTTVSSVSMLTPSGSVSGTAAIQSGMLVYGQGIPSGATVNSVSGSSFTLSSAATQTYTGNSLALGPQSNTATASTQVAVASPVVNPFNITGTWANNSTSVTVSSTAGIAIGMFVSSSSSGISSGVKVSAVGSTTITLSSKATVNQTNKTLTFTPVQGGTSNGSATVTLSGSNTSINNIMLGWLVSDSSSKIPNNTYVKAATSTQITLSNNATGAASSDTLTFTSQGGTTTTGNTTISNVSFQHTPVIGAVIVGNGIPANTTITDTSGDFSSGSGTLTVSAAATKPSNFSSSTDTTFNTALSYYSPMTFDSTYNSTNQQTPNWGGCVIEATSSGENSSGTGVLSVSGNPDTSEPVSGTSWYPYYWLKDSSNNWNNSNISKQDSSTETQGQTNNEWLAQDGPNQGCPVAVLPLTDLTTSDGQQTIQNSINSMWPRDAGGTQVHVGMIWGWRVLSPNGPFAVNNGHPLDYTTATARGWKKIIVLMTDGEEEWPAADNLTGLGQITDGKIGTTSTTTAVNNLNSRLSTLCSNMATDGIQIYTIGLGPGGSGNTQLASCPANGGFYSAATPSNLAAVFLKIAASIIHLRLTQ